MTHRNQFKTTQHALDFILGGSATVTLVSRKTGARFTYKITTSEDGTCHFVNLLSGPDNESDFKYLGRIASSTFWQGRRQPKPGDIGRDAPSMKAFAWTWNELHRDQDGLPDSLEIWHEGRCGRCNRKLTVPESIERGFGPECAGKM